MYQNHEYKNRFRILKGGLISLVVASNLYSAPSSGTVVSGNATINQNGNTTNINQSSQKASINWQDFSISKNETVNFNQPNQNSITLNRVIGNEKSIIDGALNANGQVWILNSNGTLFGKNAKVNTSGLLVTTKELSDDDFQKGNYSFKGNSKESIENQGDINLNDKAYAVFVANSVINNGDIKVHKGTVHLTGADEFSITLNENQNISLKVTKGALNSLVENNNLIVANGGNVYLTTNAKNELLKGVVNNTGIIEANSLDDITGKTNEVILFAHGGTANIDGEIKAKNSFVETSGENLSVKDSFKITANKWLLDPVNMTIEANGGSDFNSGSVSATAIQNALAGTNLELQADNNITVNQNITWSTDKQLKLIADNINVNATINNTNSTNGGVYFNAANTTGKVVFGTNGKVIVNNINQMQLIETALNGKYELGRDIDASATKTDTAKWGTAGFNPIGNSANRFAGTFDGKGFTISNLYINRPTQDFVGLFGFTNNSATIKNIGLENINITGQSNVGGLVGLNDGTVENSYASGTVSGDSYVGGLVGDNVSTIANSYALGSVSIGTNSYIGGLVGVNRRIIENSYASGIVSSSSFVGGLVGENIGGTITNSYYDNATNTASMNDSAYGKTKIEIATALKSASSEWETDFSKGRGNGASGTAELPFLKNVTKLSNTWFEDGHGTEANPYTITNWIQLRNINHSNNVIRSYYFNLLNNIDRLTTGYIGNGEGWNPIGDATNVFTGTFDGLGHTISDLYINRPTQDYIGLFGYINNSATIKNIGLENLNIRGNNIVGGLVGGNFPSGTIENSYASGTVSGNNIVGGLVGGNFAFGKISNSYALGSVGGSGDGSNVGGLVGQNNGTISNSYASGIVVSESSFAGGLIGWNNGGIITNSYYDKETNQADMRDKTYHGKTKAEILSSFSNISGWGTTGGGASVSGYEVVLLPYLLGVTKDEYKSKSILFNGGFGTALNPYTITNWTQLQNINNSNIVTRGYYFNLLNNIDRSTAGYIGTGEGWNPIGNNDNRALFKFNGLGNTISDLYINRQNNLNEAGLFGHTQSGSNIQNIGLLNVNITGGSFTGGLVGVNYYTDITNSYVTGVITGNGIWIGGLAGANSGIILNSYASATVGGNGSEKGGLVGHNNKDGKITNSYASVSVGGTSSLGGLVGSNDGTITNSFYDKTKFSGNGVGAGIETGVTGLTTEEMSYGKIFKDASWDIVADSSVISSTPILKYDSVNNKYVWAIAPKTFTANLGNQSTTYNGLLQNLSSIYTSQAIFGTAGVNFKFVDVDNNDITAYKNAGTYSNIGVVSLDEFIVAGVGTKGTLTINKANLDIIANSNSLVYNGQTQSVNGYTFGENKLLGSDTEADLNLSGITTISSSKNVGTTKTNISGTSDNYNINVAQGTLNIIKKDISVTADNKNKKQGENNPNLTYVANGLIENDTLNGTLSTNATQNSEVGSYDIEKGSLDNPNYEIDFKKGKLIVEAKTETPKPETPNIQDVVDSIFHQIAQTTQIDNQRLNTNLNTQALSFNNKFGVEIVNGGINAPTKEEEARNFQNMINK